MVTVPPLTFGTANTVIKVARMFGEVLDDVKEHLGNISVVRGMEQDELVTSSASDRENSRGFRVFESPDRSSDACFTAFMRAFSGWYGKVYSKN